MPGSLDAVEVGMAQLDGTLELLDDSTSKLRPTVKELEPLLDELRPTLREARPVLAKLPPITKDAREVLKQLVPVVPVATDIVDNIRGPVIARFDGPILKKLGKTWLGKDEYKHSGGDVKSASFFYEVIADIVNNLNP